METTQSPLLILGINRLTTQSLTEPSSQPQVQPQAEPQAEPQAKTFIQQMQLMLGTFLHKATEMGIVIKHFVARDMTNYIPPLPPSPEFGESTYKVFTLPFSAQYIAVCTLEQPASIPPISFDLQNEFTCVCQSLPVPPDMGRFLCTFEEAQSPTHDPAISYMIVGRHQNYIQNLVLLANIELEPNKVTGQENQVQTIRQWRTCYTIHFQTTDGIEEAKVSSFELAQDKKVYII